jgi:hypothetical protein
LGRLAGVLLGSGLSGIQEFIPIPPLGQPDFEQEFLNNARPMVQKATKNPLHTVADMKTRAWRQRNFRLRDCSAPRKLGRAGPCAGLSFRFGVGDHASLLAILRFFSVR